MDKSDSTDTVDNSNENNTVDKKWIENQSNMLEKSNKNDFNELLSRPRNTNGTTTPKKIEGKNPRKTKTTNPKVKRTFR